MHSFQQMAAQLNRNQMQQIKEANDLMNATMSRCYAAYIAQGKGPNEALRDAQMATQFFGVAIGIIKEVKKDDRNNGDSPIIGG